MGNPEANVGFDREKGHCFDAEAGAQHNSEFPWSRQGSRQGAASARISRGPVRERVPGCAAETNMKVLLVPPPGLKKGFYAVVSPTYLSFYKMRETSARIEGELLGKELGLESDFRVDILVIGSVAVDPGTGARVGVGHGTEELAYALLRHKKIIDESTLVVTTVHDKQLVNDIPVDKLLPYDLPVDIVCTPNYIYHTNTKIPKPTGIYWDVLLPDKYLRVNVLRELREKIGQETGEKPKLAPTGRQVRQGGKADGPSISITELNPSITEKELEQHLQGMGLRVDSVTVYQTASKKASARIVIPEDLSAEKYAAAIDKTELHGWVMQAKPTPPKAKREKKVSD
ncbi:5-formyltetrahydrofolate cyclo-ligase-like protein COG0212 [Selaginella moellendorffii]|uniref:5-formyltetrahydrofolate cyclo-ligase-like protein COG0212 n=1 Tax=Selaginella moellendorffii TaxID=88036 RepID=UPI000D1CCC09|nr:5-formyltetrahydrofolate cyclo-ligase-like protein COG0212 [Selaginella moellendorffii]|eukprot:XP_024532654.1 5-formyltetrahydrofolate cyclo-ligase-like protein COG0212 [Selaginella moellendorffii]